MPKGSRADLKQIPYGKRFPAASCRERLISGQGPVYAFQAKQDRQDGREYESGGAGEANALRGKYREKCAALIFAPNAEIGLKSFFETASKQVVQ